MAKPKTIEEKPLGHSFIRIEPIAALPTLWCIVVCGRRLDLRAGSEMRANDIARELGEGICKAAIAELRADASLK